MKPGVKLRINVELEERPQEMLQLHLSDQNVFAHLGAFYIRGLTVLVNALIPVAVVNPCE